MRMDDYIANITEMLYGITVVPCTVSYDNIEFWTKYAAFPRIMKHVNPAEFWCDETPMRLGICDILCFLMRCNVLELFERIVTYAKNIECMTIAHSYEDEKYEIMVYEKHTQLARMLYYGNLKTNPVDFGFTINRQSEYGKYYVLNLVGSEFQMLW